MSGSWSLVDLSQLGQGLELFTKKEQNTTTSNYQSTTTNTSNRSYNVAYNVASGYGSSASSSQVASPRLEPTTTPSISVIPTSSQGSGTSSTPQNNILDSLLNNLTGVAVVGGIGVLAYFLIKKKGK